MPVRPRFAYLGNAVIAIAGQMPIGGRSRRSSPRFFNTPLVGNDYGVLKIVR